MNSGSEVSCSLCSLPIKKIGQLNTCAFMTTIQPLYCTAGVCIIGHFMMAIFMVALCNRTDHYIFAL